MAWPRQAEFKRRHRSSRTGQRKRRATFRQLGDLGSFVASAGTWAASRRRRGPVALRPRLSPGGLLSRCDRYGRAGYRKRQERAPDRRQRLSAAAGGTDPDGPPSGYRRGSESSATPCRGHTGPTVAWPRPPSRSSRSTAPTCSSEAPACCRESALGSALGREAKKKTARHRGRGNALRSIHLLLMRPEGLEPPAF
jgi:hypothetical protein